MSTLYATKKRRSLQALWSKLDEHLLPYLEQGTVLAVSGGPDSRALLEAVANWKNGLSKKFVVAIIDHGQRKASSNESNVVAMRAKRLGFETVCETLPSFSERTHEHELRKLRYQLLTAIARNYDCGVICTAHHRDDDAEGFFMALMGVGGGELGASMPEMGGLDDLLLIRPFLSLGKNDLLLTLSFQNKADFVRDSLDESRVGERAYVRHEVLPPLSRHAKDLKKRAAFFGRIQRLNQEIVDQLARSFIAWQGDYAKLSLDASMEPQLLTAAIWEMIKKLSNGKDLRACKPTIDNLVLDISAMTKQLKHIGPGLDRKPNGLNLSVLNRKKYQFPGVLVIKEPGSIIAKRV